MKKQTDFNFTNMSKEQSKELTTIVNETIAIDFVPVKKFTAVDLWDIQRRSKTTINNRKLAAFY